MPEVIHSIPALNEWLDTFKSDVSNKVVRRTLLGLSSKAVTAIKNAEVESYAVKKSDISFAQIVGDDGISAIISGKRSRLTLNHFHPRQTAEGVEVQVKRGETELIPHAFILHNVGSNMFTNVFKRKGAAKYTDKGSYSLESLYGMSPALMLKSDWIRNVVDIVVMQEADRTFKQKLESVRGEW